MFWNSWKNQQPRQPFDKQLVDVTVMNYKLLFDVGFTGGVLRGCWKGEGGEMTGGRWWLSDGFIDQVPVEGNCLHEDRSQEVVLSFHKGPRPSSTQLEGYLWSSQVSAHQTVDSECPSHNMYRRKQAINSSPWWYRVDKEYSKLMTIVSCACQMHETEPNDTTEHREMHVKYSFTYVALMPTDKHLRIKN